MPCWTVHGRKLRKRKSACACGSSVTICSPSWSEAMFRPQTIWPNANCVRQSLPARYRAATRLHPARWSGRCWLPLPPPVGKTADLSLSSWLSVSGCNQPEPLSKKYGAKHIPSSGGEGWGEEAVPQHTECQVRGERQG